MDDMILRTDNRESMMANNIDREQKRQMLGHLMGSKKETEDLSKMETYIIIFMKLIFIPVIVLIMFFLLFLFFTFPSYFEELNASKELNASIEIRFLLIILPVLLFSTVMILMFHKSEKRVMYLFGSEPKLTGKYVASEQSQSSGYYKHTFIRNGHSFYAYYSTISFQEMRERTIEFMNKTLPEEEQFTKKVVIEKGFKYILFRIFCLFPVSGKLKYKLYNKLPKKGIRIRAINTLQDREFEIYRLDRLRRLEILENLEDSENSLKRDYNIKSPSQEFKINEFITLKLIGKRTELYVNDSYFQQCMYLLINIPKEKIQEYDKIESIDEAMDMQYSRKDSRELENVSSLQKEEKFHITPEQEFQAHCSNLQAWYENEYDTRLLHSNLAFPLLKKLTEVGDPLAKKVFKEEIALRFESGYSNVLSYLIAERYLDFFDGEEISTLLKDSVFYQELKERFLKKIYDRHLDLYRIRHSEFFQISREEESEGLSRRLLLRVMARDPEIHIHYCHSLLELDDLEPKIKNLQYSEKINLIILDNPRPERQHKEINLTLILDDILPERSPVTRRAMNED